MSMSSWPHLLHLEIWNTIKIISRYDSSTFDLHLAIWRANPSISIATTLDRLQIVILLRRKKTMDEAWRWIHLYLFNICLKGSMRCKSLWIASVSSGSDLVTLTKRYLYRYHSYLICLKQFACVRVLCRLYVFTCVLQCVACANKVWQFSIIMMRWTRVDAESTSPPSLAHGGLCYRTVLWRSLFSENQTDILFRRSLLEIHLMGGLQKACAFIKATSV